MRGILFPNHINQDKFLLVLLKKNQTTAKEKNFEKRGSFRTLAEKRMAAAIESIRKYQIVRTNLIMHIVMKKLSK